MKGAYTTVMRGPYHDEGGSSLRLTVFGKAGTKGVVTKQWRIEEEATPL